ARSWTAPTVHSDRQMNRKRRARSQTARDGNGTTLALYGVFHDGETQSRTARLSRPRFIHAVEAFENPGQFVGGNPVAGVCNGKMQGLVMKVCGNAYFPARFVVVNRVIDEVR